MVMIRNDIDEAASVMIEMIEMSETRQNQGCGMDRLDGFLQGVQHRVPKPRQDFDLFV